MEEYSSILRALADLLDDDFKSNVKRVAAILAELLVSFIRYELK